MKGEHEGHHRTFPTWLSFLLNNPIRRHFDKTPEKVIAMLGINSESVIVDFGCGPGFYSIPFAKVAKRVVAVDLQDKMLKKAEAYAETKGVKDKIEFVKSDGKAIPELEGNSCDFVFSGFVFHEIDGTSKEKVLAELRRVLRPDGKLALMEYTKRPLVGPHSINPGEVKEELVRAGFAKPDLVEVSKNVGLIAATRVLP